MKTIYFGNLPREANRDFLKYIVKPFGWGYEIRVIPTDNPDGQYGFVDMKESEADALLDYFKTRTLTFMGAKIAIGPAKGNISERSARINEQKKKEREKTIQRIKAKQEK